MALPDSGRLPGFADGLAQIKNVALTHAQTGMEAVNRIAALPGEKRPHLVIFDDALADGPGSKLVTALMGVDAMILTALVSDMPHAEFHDKTEGLGILSQIPPTAGQKEAKDLVDKLKGLV